MKGLKRLEEIGLIIKGLESERQELYRAQDPYRGRILSQDMQKRWDRVEKRIDEIEEVLEVYVAERRDLQWEKALAS